MHSKYNLSNFCNVITMLRKEKMWTQTKFAEILGVSPQSVSKWECGVGYPDVTLFPVIADALNVPIGVLFGESSNPVIRYSADKEEVLFDICGNINVSLGNICRVEFIEEASERGIVKVQGDMVFRHYFDVETNNDTVFVNIKNPVGSETHWKEYDRLGFTGENVVQIFTGCAKDTVNIKVINYLDLEVTSKENGKGRYEVRCCKEENKRKN